MNLLRKLIVGTGLALSLTLGMGVALTGPTPVQAADNYCIDDDGQIRPDSLAPCLDPTPDDANKTQDYAWITDMWNWSLSLVNIFAALVLITMAFANILYPWQALEQFRIRQLLPTFIWGVILANASLFICRAIVTLADLLMSDAGLQVDPAKLFINWGFDPGLLSLGTMAAMFGTQTPNGIGDLFYQFIFSVIFIFIPIIGMIILSFIFYFRTALIFILTALSPLAFASIIFPPTRGFLGRWWDWFWKWTFGGVASWVILFVASLITVSEETRNQGGFTTDLLPYFLTFALVYMAIMAPFKLGGAISGMIEKLGRKGVGMGVGLTKFAGGKGYHYASLGATRGIGTAEKKLDDLKKSGTATAAQISAAERSVRNRKSLRDLIRSPSIVRDTLDTVQASEQKAIKKGELGSGLRTGLIEQMLPGDEAAKAYLGAAGEAQKDWTPADLSATLRGTDWYQKGVAAGWIDGDFRDKMMSGKKYDELIERAKKNKVTISKKDLAETGSALKYAGRYQNVYRYGSRDPKAELEQMGAYAPAGAAVGAVSPTVYNPREAHLEDAVSKLQGLTQTTDPHILREALATATEGNTLNTTRFREALAPRMSLESLAPEIKSQMETALAEYSKGLGRFSAKPIDATMAAKVTADWEVETGTNTDNLRDSLQETGRKAEEALKSLAEGEGSLEIDAGDREVIAKIHPKMQIKIEKGEIKTKDDLRHKLQEQIVGARTLDEQLKIAEEQAEQALDADLAANPGEVKAEAAVIVNIATKAIPGNSQGLAGISGKDMSALMGKFKQTEGLINKALLANMGGPEKIDVVKNILAEIHPEIATRVNSTAAANQVIKGLKTGMLKVNRSVREAIAHHKVGDIKATAAHKQDAVANMFKREYGAAAAATTESAADQAAEE